MSKPSRASSTQADAAGTVGIIGLGIMGGSMARCLLGQGYRVIGHDPLSRCRQALRKAGGTPAASNAEVAQRADLLILSLPSAQALHTVVHELAGALPKQQGQIVVETSTLPLQDKQQAAAELRRQGRVMLDAPISGTATPDPQDTWIAYLSGPAAACRRVAPVLRCFTLAAPRIGPLGHGTRLKLAANHLVAIYNVAYAEMVSLCRSMGLDPAVALQHMGHSPYIGTGAMRLRVPMMIERQYEPATMKLRLWQKDMQVIGDMARAVHCPTPLLDTCASVYTAAMAQGWGEHDTAVTAEVLAQWANEPGSARSRRGSGRRPAR